MMMEETILGEMTMTLDGNILTSSGQLENNERVSGVVQEAMNLIQTHQLDPPPPSGDNGGGSLSSTMKYRKVSFVFSNRAYLIIRSGNKYIVTMKSVSEPPNIGHLMHHSQDSSTS